MQDAVNTIKDYLLTSEIRLVFPLSPEVIFDLRLSQRVTRQQFGRLIEVIRLAEDSCVLPEEAPVVAPFIASAVDELERAKIGGER
jgi:hypothetical protein